MGLSGARSKDGDEEQRQAEQNGGTANEHGPMLPTHPTWPTAPQGAWHHSPAKGPGTF